jgi:hypothetical protein
MFRRVIVATVTMFFQQWTGKIAAADPDEEKLTSVKVSTQFCTMLLR